MQLLLIQKVPLSRGSHNRYIQLTSSTQMLTDSNVLLLVKARTLRCKYSNKHPPPWNRDLTLNIPSCSFSSVTAQVDPSLNLKTSPLYGSGHVPDGSPFSPNSEWITLSSRLRPARCPAMAVMTYRAVASAGRGMSMLKVK